MPRKILGMNTPVAAISGTPAPKWLVCCQPLPLDEPNVGLVWRSTASAKDSRVSDPTRVAKQSGRSKKSTPNGSDSLTLVTVLPAS